MPPPGKTVPTIFSPRHFMGLRLWPHTLAGPEKPVYAPDTLPPVAVREAGGGVSVNVDDTEAFQGPVPEPPWITSEHGVFPLPLAVKV
jgi:hypothetical protein